MFKIKHYLRAHPRLATLTEIAAGVAIIPVAWLLSWALSANSNLLWLLPLSFIAILGVALWKRRYKVIIGLLSAYIANLLVASFLAVTSCGSALCIVYALVFNGVFLAPFWLMNGIMYQ